MKRCVEYQIVARTVGVKRLLCGHTTFYECSFETGRGLVMLSSVHHLGVSKEDAIKLYDLAHGEPPFGRQHSASSPAYDFATRYAALRCDGAITICCPRNGQTRTIGALKEKAADRLKAANTFVIRELRWSRGKDLNLRFLGYGGNSLDVPALLNPIQPGNSRRPGPSH
jgi:hypothetical protein